jgi:hypothetical protein
MVGRSMNDPLVLQHATHHVFPIYGAFTLDVKSVVK